MKKPHLHKLPTYRNTTTKQRAVLTDEKSSPAVLVDFFDYKKRVSDVHKIYGSKTEALQDLSALGFDA